MARKCKADSSGSRHRMLCLALVVAGVVLALTSAPTLATTPSVPALDRGWTSSSLGVPPTQGGQFTKVVAGGPGLLALGGTSSSAQPIVLWSSTDGLHWRSVPLGNDVFPENATVSDMVAGPHGIVITGEIQSGGPLVGAARAWVFWWSPDGRHWSRSATPALPDGPIFFVESVAAGPTGFAAIVQVIPPPSSGQTVPPFPRVVLTSPDGRTWQQAPSPVSTFAPFYQDGIAEGGPGYVLVGTNQAQGVSYTSRDGRTWSGPFPLPGSALGCCALFAAHGLLIAVESGATGQRIWTSTDGQRWQASTWQAGSESVIGTITSVGNLLVAMGRSAGSSVLWASTDGHHWTQAADDRAFERSPAQRAELRSIVGFRDGLEAVGSIGPAPTAIGGSFGYGLCNPSPTATELSPTAWRWTPQQSAAAPSSRPSPLDPRTFSLRPSDMPGADGPFRQGGYASICSSPFSQALGRYTAYQSGFLFRAWSLTIVAESGKAAHAALLRAPTFFAPSNGYPGGAKEQRVTKRIGTETRLFATQVLIPNGDDAPMRVPARAVIWRRSRQMGIVVVYSSKDRGPQGLVVDALRFAAAQDAHLRQVLAR